MTEYSRGILQGLNMQHVSICNMNLVTGTLYTMQVG